MTDEKKNSALARLLAVIALITAVIVIIVAIGAAVSSDEDAGNPKQNTTQEAPVKPKTNKKNYKVQEGDNLTMIAEKTGIPVDQLESLNPGLDPQTLQPGQKLKLR